MNVLIIYESMFGNTARVAHAIRAGLGEHVPVTVKTIGEVEALPPDIDLLIVGGPTYAHGVEAGMKRFLDVLPDADVAGVNVTAFDTRLDWPAFLSGAASKGIARELERKGARPLTAPASFRVKDKDGPLVDGEERRAVDWGRELAALLAARPGATVAR